MFFQFADFAELLSATFLRSLAGWQSCRCARLPLSPTTPATLGDCGTLGTTGCTGTGASDYARLRLLWLAMGSWVPVCWCTWSLLFISILDVITTTEPSILRALQSSQKADFVEKETLGNHWQPCFVEKAASWSPGENCKKKCAASRVRYYKTMRCDQKSSYTKNNLFKKTNTTKVSRILMWMSKRVHGPLEKHVENHSCFVVSILLHKMGCFVGSKWLKIFAFHLVL